MLPNSGWEGRALPVVNAPWRYCHHRGWPEPSIILCCRRLMASALASSWPQLSLGGAACRRWQWSTTTLPSRKHLRSQQQVLCFISIQPAFWIVGSWHLHSQQGLASNSHCTESERLCCLPINLWPIHWAGRMNFQSCLVGSCQEQREKSTL